MATPCGILTNQKFVPHTVAGGLRGGRGASRGGWEGSAEYSMLLELKSWSILQYVIPYVWHLPKFLFNERSFNQMNMASLMFPVVPCSSLWFPMYYGEAVWTDWMPCCVGVMGEGALRCYFTLPP